MTKFKVGDKVRILDAKAILGASHYGIETGGIYEVSSIDSFGDPRVEELALYTDELPYIEKVSDKPTKNQRISSLEQQVAELQAQVATLKQTEKPAVKLSGEYAILHKGEEIIHGNFKSPNEQRKAIIAEAKAFVEKYSGVVKVDETPFTSKNGDTIVKLFVNAKKRTVTAVPNLYHVNAEFTEDKRFAKCAPDDVFNADIGKAIALGRALGLDVSRFEQAVKPTVFAVGQIVSSRRDKHSYKVVPDFRVDNEVLSVKHCKRYFTELQIIDDTEAQY